MIKSRANLSIDADLLIRAKKLGINLSSSFQDYLEMLTNRQNIDLDSINLDLLDQEINDLQGELSEMKSKLIDKLNQKKQIEDAIKEKQKKLMEEEREALKQIHYCEECGKLISRAYLLKHPGTKFCSIECLHKDWKKKRP